MIKKTIFAVVNKTDKHIDVCEEEVYKSLFFKYSKGVRDYLYLKTGDLQQAEDLMQDTFLKFWQKCKEIIFDQSNLFLFATAKRLFIDLTRRKKVEVAYKQKIDLRAKNTETPEFQLELKEFKQKLETVLANMPEKSRLVFVMNRIEKLKYREIAVMLGLSQKAVEKRMSIALEYFYSQIKK